MQYNAPYGSTNANAGYVNGTPSTRGSVIPAAAIEQPQREIVNAITALGGTPTSGSVDQLAKGLLTTSFAYDSTINYDKKRPVIGSDGLLYIWKKANGPASTIVNPVNDTEEEYWMKYNPSPEISTGSNTTTGLVKLSDEIDGTETAVSGETAASPYAVKQIYDIILSLETIMAEFQTQLITELDTLTTYQNSVNTRIANLQSRLSTIETALGIEESGLEESL